MQMSDAMCVPRKRIRVNTQLTDAETGLHLWSNRYDTDFEDNRLGAGEIEPAHLLLALMRDPANGLTDLLAEKGVTADWLRERLAPD